MRRRARALALAAGGSALLLAVPSMSAAHARRRHHHHKRHDERVVVTTTKHTRHVVPPPTAPPPPPTPLAHLQVVAREFSLTPSRLTLPAGRAVVELDNFGQDPHDLRVERVEAPAARFDFTLTRAGDRESQSLQLTAGTWKLYCTLPGHEALGMHTLITVGG